MPDDEELWNRTARHQLLRGNSGVDPLPPFAAHHQPTHHDRERFLVDRYKSPSLSLSLRCWHGWIRAIITCDPYATTQLLLLSAFRYFYSFLQRQERSKKTAGNVSTVFRTAINSSTTRSRTSYVPSFTSPASNSSLLTVLLLVVVRMCAFINCGRTEHRNW